MRSMTMETAPDKARDELLAEFQPFIDKTGIRPFGHDVLIGVYSRAGKKTSGGIILTETYREDDYQGITGVILGMGPMCQGETFNAWFGNEPPKEGDWVGFSVKDGTRFLIGDRICRLIEWKYLRFATRVPDYTM
jgi:co-chaperonin GroES (HSP10)